MKFGMGILDQKKMAKDIKLSENRLSNNTLITGLN